MGQGSNGVITGRIFGLDSGATQLAQVIAYSNDSLNCFGAFGTVESDGSYAIADLPPGSYYVYASAADYLPEYYDNVSTPDSAKLVQVDDGRTTRGIDFTLEKPRAGTGSIAGKVVGEPGNMPIAGAWVYLYSVDNPCLGGYAQTDEHGDYVVEGLIGGSYYVQVYADGYISEFFDNAVRPEDASAVRVVEPNRTGRIDFALDRGGSISGHITDASGAPLAGAMVNAIADSSDLGGCFVAVTDENGDYTITGLLSGRYMVMAQAWGNWFSDVKWYDNVRTMEQATPVAVRLDRTTDGIDFSFDIPAANGSISGFVLDGNGQPIAGAFVSAEMSSSDPNRFPVWAYAETDASGFYRIDGVPDGEYLVSAFAQVNGMSAQKWWRNADDPASADIMTVSGGSCSVPSVDFILDLMTGSASISGTIRRSDGSPLADAGIDASLIDPATGVMQVVGYGFTTDDGTYEIAGLPAGTYYLHAYYWGAEGFAEEWYENATDPSGATQVTLADNDRRGRIDFTLAPHDIFGSITGRITDATTGQPVERAYVEVWPMEGDPFGTFGLMPNYAITDADGRYQIDGQPEGKYMMTIIGDGAVGYYRDVQDPNDATLIDVRGGDTTTADDRLSRSSRGTGTITGRVTEDGRTAVDFALVIAMPVDPTSGDIFTAVTKADGSYQLAGLPDGDYYILAFGPSYLGEYYDNAFDPADATPLTIAANTISGIDFSMTKAGNIVRGPNGVPSLTSGTVYGKVTASSGASLANATVYAVNGAKEPIAFARTAEDGSYALSGLPPGTNYRIFATHPGFAIQYNDRASSYAGASPVKVSREKVEVNFALPSATSGVDDRNASGSSSIGIAGSRPNPFSSRTEIGFTLATSSHVRITVLNLLGEKVAELFDGTMSAGEHGVSWNGTNEAGSQVESGLYFYRIENGSESRNGTMTLTR
jgi:protocatechuate 3,4-dioxygenase beta subunit